MSTATNAISTVIEPRPLVKPWNDFRSFIRAFEAPFFRALDNDRDFMTADEWSPSVDVVEEEDRWTLKADLPEIKKEDVKVTVEKGVLSIAGERKLEKEEKNKRYHRIERSYGAFQRSFALPDGTDGTKITAEFKDGVLQVHLPKNGAPRPKALEVKVH